MILMAFKYTVYIKFEYKNLKFEAIAFNYYQQKYKTFFNIKHKN